jgi:hypothetical protein
MRTMLLILLLLVTVGCSTPNPPPDVETTNGSYKVVTVALDRGVYYVTADKLDSGNRHTFLIYLWHNNGVHKQNVPAVGEQWSVQWKTETRRYEFIQKESK